MLHPGNLSEGLACSPITVGVGLRNACRSQCFGNGAGCEGDTGPTLPAKHGHNDSKMCDENPYAEKNFVEAVTSAFRWVSLRGRQEARLPGPGEQRAHRPGGVLCLHRSLPPSSGKSRTSADPQSPRGETPGPKWNQVMERVFIIAERCSFATVVHFSSWWLKAQIVTSATWVCRCELTRTTQREK